MTKLEFLASFRQACENMPDELVEAAIVEYERQFTDALLSGQSEPVIVERWGSPQHAALKLKLGTLNGNLKQAVTVEKVARVGISGAGLALLDFLLLAPATLYFILLGAFYLVAAAVYLSGIFISASSLAGVNYIDIPAYYLLDAVGTKGSTKINLGNIDIEPTYIGIDVDAEKRLPELDKADNHAPHFMRDRGFHIATHVNHTTIWKGISTTVAGMLLLVLCLLTTRFTFRQIKQFVVWHFTVLKNA